jgi:hypothetical protein
MDVEGLLMAEFSHLEDIILASSYYKGSQTIKGSRSPILRRPKTHTPTLIILDAASC